MLTEEKKETTTNPWLLITFTDIRTKIAITHEIEETEMDDATEREEKREKRKSNTLGHV